jgi:hypothetical protein
MARAGAASLIQPRLEIALPPQRDFAQTLRYWTNTGRWYRTAYIRSLDGRVLPGTNVLSCWRVERSEEQNQSNTRVPHWMDTACHTGWTL